MQPEKLPLEDLRLRHGMMHPGLSEAAQKIERTVAFKRTYFDVIGPALGFDDRQEELATTGGESSLPAHHLEYLAGLDPNGFAAPGAARRFVDAEIAAVSPLVTEGGSLIRTGEEITNCCIRVPWGWKNCSGWFLRLDGEPWTVSAVVEEFERRHGEIAGSDVRAELADIQVFVQLEAELRLS